MHTYFMLEINIYFNRADLILVVRLINNIDAFKYNTAHFI